MTRHAGFGHCKPTVFKFHAKGIYGSKNFFCPMTKKKQLKKQVRTHVFIVLANETKNWKWLFLCLFVCLFVFTEISWRCVKTTPSRFVCPQITLKKYWFENCVLKLRPSLSPFWKMRKKSSFLTHFLFFNALFFRHNLSFSRLLCFLHPVAVWAPDAPWWHLMVSDGTWWSLMASDTS